MSSSIMRLILVAVSAWSVSACTVADSLPTVEYVDLQRFMGDWYVIANIPTRLERGAHNAVENYRLDDDGTIATTFTFLDGSFQGKPKEYHPRGFIRNTETNAEWGMRFVWPIKADYRIVYLDENYDFTIIGRNKRDYVWLMARSPEIAEAKYAELVQLIGSMGYELADIERVPQKW